MVQPEKYRHWKATVYIALLIPLSAILWTALRNGSSKHHELDVSLSFHPYFQDQVALRIITAERYGLGDDANEEWSKTLPESGHLVHLNADASGEAEAHTVTLFHQLKCLDIIRAQYKLPATAPISPRTGHCLNYLRQTVLCRPNLRLESVDDEFGHSDRNYYDTVCNDWTAVYREAERNHVAYNEWKNEHSRD
ncbi:hypothetical protein C8R45DRAFT_910982 [Mycena sanguinolenta]|nr:hypothetical protein C8R45DRAFT_910982 [Mycena sanguinolenta]